MKSPDKDLTTSTVKKASPKPKAKLSAVDAYLTEVKAESSRPPVRPSAESNALNFFAEAGLLKHIKRSGWWVAGIKDPESVAEHSFRCAVIGYYLAHLENVDPLKVLTMALFNDIHEARINDLHKMGHHYIDFRDAEQKVFEDQMKLLDQRVQKQMASFRDEYNIQKTKESIVARDADILECLLQAKEYYDSGHTKAKKFFQKAPKHLKSRSAKNMWQQIRRWDSSQWWENVVKFER